MFCRTCGNTVKEGAKFCPKCGTPALAAPKAEVAKEPEVVAPTSAVKGVKEKAPKAPKAPKVPLGVKEVTKVRGISVVGIIMAFLSMGMLPLWWFSSPNGGGWDILGDGKFPLYLMFEMVEDLGLDSVTEIIANIIVITAICLAAIAMVLYLLYIIFEFTKSKKSFCMILASVISLMLIAVSATVAFGMTIVQIGDIGAVLDSLTGDFIGFFTDEAIMLSIPVGVLLVTSILGMCFAKYNKKVVTYAPAATAPVAPVRPAAPKAPAVATAPVKPAMPTAPTAPVAPAAPKSAMPTAPTAPVMPTAPKPAMPTAPTAPVMPTAPKPAMPTAPTAPVMPTAPKPAMPTAPTATVTPEVKVDIAPAVKESEGEVKEGGSRLTSTMRRHAPETTAAPAVESTSKPASTSDAFMRAGDL